MRTAFDQVRLALRSLRQQPRHGGFIIASFAIVVGATTAAYSAVDGLLLRPLPFPDAHELVFIGELGATESGPDASVTSRQILHRLENGADTLSGVATYSIWEATLTDEGAPTRLSGARVTWSYFETLGHPASIGRTFRPEEDVEGAPPVVVISHRLWRGRFGADEGIVGRVIDLNGAGHEVIGVMPASFESPDQYTFSSAIRARPDIWRTFRSPVSPNTRARSVRGIARVAEGSTLQEVFSELAVFHENLRSESSEWPDGRRVVVLPLKAQFTAALRPALLLLLGAAAFLLMAGCVNVMSLVLARGIDREGELRVRRALGAARGTLLRQVTLETVVFGVIGGLLGIALAALGIEGLLRVAPAGVPRIETVRLQPETIAVAIGTAVLAAMAAGVLPGLRLFWGSGAIATRGGRGITAGRSRQRTLSLFTSVQVALAIALLVGSGLLVHSFVRLVSLDPGYDATGVLSVQLDLPADSSTARLVIIDEILKRVEESPLVLSAAMMTTLPQHGLNDFDVLIGPVDGYDGDDDPAASHRRATDTLADTLGMRVLAGRFPRRSDVTGEGETFVTAAAVNREFVRRFVPNGEPIGLTVGTGFGADARIVGVVENVKYGWPGKPDLPEMYIPLAGAFSTVFLSARTVGDPELALSPVRDAVAEVAPGVPVEEIFFQEELLAGSLAMERTTMGLMVSLGVIASVLAALGLYGTVDRGVARRRQEIGVRLAVGASPGRVVKLVTRDAMVAILAGAAGGLGLAYAIARAGEALLYGVEITDPVSFIGASILLLLVGAVACLLPARRACVLDPVDVLRSE